VSQQLAYDQRNDVGLVAQANRDSAGKEHLGAKAWLVPVECRLACSRAVDD
jgi:hypothetical protein